MYKIIKPTTEQELAAYFHFRWQILKAPFNFPEGSEKDEYELVAEHRMIVNVNNDIMAIGRVHFNTAEEVQIRHIAVAFEAHGKGYGSLIVATLEKVAIEQGAIRAVTNSLESSRAFFEICGYTKFSAPEALRKLNRIHMLKKLSAQQFLIHPKWCQELQSTWENTIPISDQMGIKIHQYSGTTLEVRASLNKNINLHGSMFAGSIFSLGTLAGWGMIFLELKRKKLEGEIVLGDGNIHYHKPITMQPRAQVHIEHYECDYQALNNGNKMRVDLTVNILDGDTPVAEFKGTYWVLPQKKTTD